MYKDKILFPTWEEEIMRTNGQLIENYKMIVGTPAEDEEVLAINSSDYGFVGNQEVFDTISEVLKNQGLNPKFNERCSGKVNHKYIIAIDIDKNIAPAGDECGLQIIAINGYKYVALKLMTGIIRLVCSNGMIRMDVEESVKRIHNSQLDLNEIQSLIDKLIEKSEKFTIRLEEIMEDKLTFEYSKVIERIASIAKGDAELFESSFKSIVFSHIYDLYNALTWFTTHIITARSAKYFQYQQLVNKLVWNKL